MASVEQRNTPDPIVEQVRESGLLNPDLRQAERAGAATRSIGDRQQMIDDVVKKLSTNPDVQKQFPTAEALRRHIEGNVIPMANGYKNFHEQATTKEGKSIWKRLWEHKWTIAILALLAVAGYFGYKYWNWNKHVSNVYKQAALQVGKGKEILIGAPAVATPGIAPSGTVVPQSGGMGMGLPGQVPEY